MLKFQTHKRAGFSKFNKIYEFDLQIFNQRCQMIMTSVSGHLLALEFKEGFKKWGQCHPVELFNAPVEKYCPENFVDIHRTLAREISHCQKLIIWTDCDREGEHIGFEIIDVCQEIKPNVDIYRANFSEITQASMRYTISRFSN